MQKFRSFIAIPLAPVVSRAAVRLIEQLKDSADGIKWVPTDNLHLTLKFLGDVDNVEIPEICGVVESVCADYPPFELDFVGAGGFPNIQRPRIVYAGINDTTGALCEIVAKLERELADLGFKPEPRDYVPHLTLGRTRSSTRRVGEVLVDELAKRSELHLGTMEVDEVQMMASFLDKAGPTYQVMHTIEL